MIKNAFDKILNNFSNLELNNHVGIDLGTSGTLVSLNGKKIDIKFPTLLAFNKKTNQVNAIGEQARTLLGRTPQHIEIIQPIKNGVIKNYQITEQLFLYIFRKIQKINPKFFGNKVVVGAPCGIKEGEIDALKKVILTSGASSVNIVYEPIAAAVGAEIPFHKIKSTLIIDIGGGTTDIMLLAKGEIIFSESILIAGDKFNKSIIEGILQDRGIEIGIRMAEDIKIRSMEVDSQSKKFIILGKSMKTGLPEEEEISLQNLLNYIKGDIFEISLKIKKIIETFSPEVLADLEEGNVYFVGGGTFISDFNKVISKHINLDIKIPKDPISLVARGAAKISRNESLYEKYFL